MTKNQKVKYFDNTDQEKKNRTAEERINQFLQQDSVNAIGIAMSKYGTFVLYEEKI